MSEFNPTNVDDATQDEPYEKAYAVARDVFDEQDRIEEEAARHFGVSVDYVRKGQTGIRPTPRIENWMRARFEQAGWEYRD